MTSRVDKAFLVLSGVFVAGLAVVAGAISFAHMAELATRHGQSGWKSGAFPVSVDGLELVASLYVLAQHRAGRRSGVLPWAALLVGTAASLAANVAVGAHEPVGRALAGWPAISLLVSIKLLFSMFDHAKNDHRTVRDDQRTVRDDQRTVRDDQRTVRDDQRTVLDGPPVSGTVQGTGRDDARPSGTTGGPGTDRTGPAALDPRAVPGAGPAGRGGAANDARDVANLIPAARAARAALTATGRRLSRDALADRMRDDGHGVSNARAGLLVKILKAEDTATPIGPAPSAPDDEDPGGSPDIAA
jgi:hypothetical protein